MFTEPLEVTLLEATGPFPAGALGYCDAVSLRTGNARVAMLHPIAGRVGMVIWTPAERFDPDPYWTALNIMQAGYQQVHRMVDSADDGE